MARGLDVFGDRWTLLVVRELLTGPKRYGDLTAGLPGIATNLLADRLRTLTANGVIARAPRPGPGCGRPYELTAWGRELEPVPLGLARWAARQETCGGRELRIGDEAVHVTIADGAVHPADGAAPHPDVTIRSDPSPFLAWAPAGGRHPKPWATASTSAQPTVAPTPIRSARSTSWVPCSGP